MGLVARQEVIEWGSTPLFPWLTALEELPQLRALLQELLQLSTFDEQGRSECRGCSWKRWGGWDDDAGQRWSR